MVITNHTSFQRNNSEGMAGSDPIEFDNFLGFFNQTLDKYDSSIPRARIIDKRRRSILNARVRQFGLDAVKDVVEKAARSDFLNFMQSAIDAANSQPTQNLNTNSTYSEISELSLCYQDNPEQQDSLNRK